MDTSISAGGVKPLLWHRDDPVHPQGMVVSGGICVGVDPQLDRVGQAEVGDLLLTKLITDN